VERQVLCLVGALAGEKAALFQHAPGRGSDRRERRMVVGVVVFAVKHTIGRNLPIHDIPRRIPVKLRWLDHALARRITTVVMRGKPGRRIFGEGKRLWERFWSSTTTWIRLSWPR
jgi:hypothetical protein